MEMPSITQRALSARWRSSGIRTESVFSLSDGGFGLSLGAMSGCPGRFCSNPIRCLRASWYSGKKSQVEPVSCRYFRVCLLAGFPASVAGVGRLVLKKVRKGTITDVWDWFTKCPL